MAIVLAALAADSWRTVAQIERGNPPTGRLVDVDGGQLHVVELGDKRAPAVVIVHGASGNLLEPKLILGDRLSARYHVILVDRPGHGWSARPDGAADATPMRQAELIHQAVARLGVSRPLLVGHSWGGALAVAYALKFSDDLSGLMLLAPVTHPWPGGVPGIYHVAAAPVIGPLLRYLLVAPAGQFLIAPGVAEVFAPQKPPPDFARNIHAELLLRPAEYLANAQDLVALHAAVTEMAPRYGAIKMPVTVIAGTADRTVYTDIHARAFAREVPQTRLIVLPGVGHMVAYAATDLVIAEIDRLAGAARTAPPAGG